mmetsp:Transcript_74164/g.194509  ORF Transcript_74164/g.194509 Transcript_74164/m.194509 type:complete len:334 (+) Transcript_74164:1087-2088(+)
MAVLEVCLAEHARHWHHAGGPSSHDALQGGDPPVAGRARELRARPPHAPNPVDLHVRLDLRQRAGHAHAAGTQSPPSSSDPLQGLLQSEHVRPGDHGRHHRGARHQGAPAGQRVGQTRCQAKGYALLRRRPPARRRLPQAGREVPGLGVALELLGGRQILAQHAELHRGHVQVHHGGALQDALELRRHAAAVPSRRVLPRAASVHDGAVARLPVHCDGLAPPGRLRRRLLRGSLADVDVLEGRRGLRKAQAAHDHVRDQRLHVDAPAAAQGGLHAPLQGRAVRPRGGPDAAVAGLPEGSPGGRGRDQPPQRGPRDQEHQPLPGGPGVLGCQVI